MSFIKKLRETTYCRLKPSTISGVGVFAIRDIPVGIDPFQGCIMFGHKEIPESEIDTLHPNVAKYIKDLCVLQDGTYKVPKHGMNVVDVSFYINHSSEPNMTTDDGGFFITLRDIKEGEELTVDYGTYNDEF